LQPRTRDPGCSDVMTLSRSRAAAAVNEPVKLWLSNAEPFACDAPQQQLDGREQPSGSRGSRQMSPGYAMQTQPWAVRFYDHQLENYFQSRRAAGKLTPFFAIATNTLQNPFSACEMHACCSSRKLKQIDMAATT